MTEPTPSPDQLNRLYAANLLNRAELAFDARDVALLGRVIELLEADIARLVHHYADEVDTVHSTGGGFARRVADLIAEGRHRPELPQPHPGSASLESNVK